jgi:hypothetical protein
MAEKLTTVIHIHVRPAARAGLYVASLGDRDLCTSRQPFLDAARVLLGEGLDPETVVVMRWVETGTESLTATVGVAAKLTVWQPDKGRPYFAEWKPRHSSVVASPMRAIDQGATLVTAPSSWAA